MNLIDFFDRTASRHPGRTCVTGVARTWTYREMSDFATRVGNGLKAFGVVRETKCAVLSRNDPLSFGAFLGILKAQGAWVPVHTGNGAAENLHLLEFFDVEILFYGSEFEEFARHAKARVPAIRQFICLDSAGHFAPCVLDWAERQSGEPIRLEWDPDAMCMLRGTGGTTGLPKGVMNTNRNFETTLANFLARLRFDAPPVYLAAAPLSHAAGVFAWVCIAFEGTMVIHRRFDAQQVLQAIGEQRVSMLYLPPTAIYTLMSQPNARRFDYSSLRHFLYGAAPTASAKLREAVQLFGNVMTQCYGQTEVPTSVASLTPEEHLDAHGNIDEKRLLSCGRPSPFVRVELMDHGGRIVDRGNIGEIVVQGGLVMKGYYKNAEATAEVSWHGWHHTGDLAYQDDDGYMYIVDRAKDMIITGGFNVYPLEVEQVILSHPSVQDCAVVGVPDEKWGEAIKAVVELKPGYTVDRATLVALCKQKIGSIKAPKSVDFVDRMPRSAVGKVMRKEVRKRYWEGQDRQVS